MATFRSINPRSMPPHAAAREPGSLSYMPGLKAARALRLSAGRGVSREPLRVVSPGLSVGAAGWITDIHSARLFLPDRSTNVADRKPTAPPS